MTTSPTQISITFNENLIPKFSGVELKDQTGKMIATGKAATDPANKKQLVVPLQEQLAPGDYKVDVVFDPLEMEAVLRTQAYHVIILDYVIPGLETAQVLEWIREYHGRWRAWADGYLAGTQTLAGFPP